MNNDDQRVRERAHKLWEQAGCPGDRSLEFWYAAVRELQEEAAPGEPLLEPGVPDASPEPAPLRLVETPAAEPRAPNGKAAKPAAAPKKKAR